ncbi:MAG: hypothetical protein EAZ71_13405 [Verrucomicrobia bacterium]|nr:MAG: hypothetical protein EAZ71_13405 [Verrucomicrobiota bacterium]
MARGQELQVLDGLEDRYQVSSATVIRWALRALANHMERNNGRLILPLKLDDQEVPKAAKTSKKRDR